MKGFVPTPPDVVDQMVALLFSKRAPRRSDRVLDPGCGPGAFVEGILRWVTQRGGEIPQIVAVELHPVRAREAAAKFADVDQVSVINEDFLTSDLGEFDFIIGNPPYVAITGLSEDEKATSRRLFKSAVGRFDLYMLFIEKSLGALRQSGRMVFITPEKYLYVDSARVLRRILGERGVDSILLAREDVFAPLITYPAITVVDSQAIESDTRLMRRDGATRMVRFGKDGASLMPQVTGGAFEAPEAWPTLQDVCVRVSAGVATGADRIFVRRANELDADLLDFAFPTISGRQLLGQHEPLRCQDRMLVPYDCDGTLLAEERLGSLGKLLNETATRERLERRTCARRKPWYAFHETPPLGEAIRPKILCKDIGADPEFWIDREGDILPRHTVYYIVPRDSSKLDALHAWLSGPEATAWLRAHCQRAANGYIRMQSTVLKRLPVPPSLRDADREELAQASK